MASNTQRHARYINFGYVRSVHKYVDAEIIPFSHMLSEESYKNYKKSLEELLQRFADANETPPVPLPTQQELLALSADQISELLGIIDRIFAEIAKLPATTARMLPSTKACQEQLVTQSDHIAHQTFHRGHVAASAIRTAVESMESTLKTPGCSGLVHLGRLRSMKRCLREWDMFSDTPYAHDGLQRCAKRLHETWTELQGLSNSGAPDSDMDGTTDEEGRGGA